MKLYVLEVLTFGGRAFVSKVGDLTLYRDQARRFMSPAAALEFARVDRSREPKVMPA